MTFARTHGVTAAAAKHFELAPPTLYRWLGRAKEQAPVENAPTPIVSVSPARSSRSNDLKAVVNLLTVAVDLLTARSQQAKGPARSAPAAPGPSGIGGRRCFRQPPRVPTHP